MQVVAVDLPSGHKNVSGRNRICHVENGQSAGGKRVRVHLDVDRARRPVNLRHGNALEHHHALGDHVVGVIVEVAHRERIRRHRDVHDRLRIRIYGLKAWRSGQVVGKVSHGALDGGLHFGLRLAHILVQHKLQNDAADALLVAGGNEMKTLDLHHLNLERCRDVVRHDLRARAGIVGRHRNHGIRHVGKLANRQSKVGRYAEYRRRDGAQRRHHRLANERLGQVHRTRVKSRFCEARSLCSLVRRFTSPSPGLGMARSPCQREELEADTEAA